jgi:hypothetical protein
MIPHRGNPAISFQVYFKNGIHKLTIAARRACPEGVPESPVHPVQVYIFPAKVALRALSSDYVNPSLRPPGAAGS